VHNTEPKVRAHDSEEKNGEQNSGKKNPAVTASRPLAARAHRLIRVNPEVSEEKLLATVDRTLWADTGDLALDWVFIALETSATKAVRRHLIASGLSRRSIQHQGYWTRGRAMGTTPED